MNNLLKTFRRDKHISYNKNEYSFSYIVQFDNFGQKVLKELLNSKNKNQKIIIPVIPYNDEN